MDISIYLEPLKVDNFFSEKNNKKLGGQIIAYTDKNNFPDVLSAEIVIIGVNEDRQALNNPGCSQAPDKIREYLYNLYPGPWKTKITDIGNILMGHDVKDTYFALKSIIAELISANVFPLIIGGSQDLTWANYLAYESLGQIINLVAVDNSFNIGESEKEVDSENYLSKIILHQPSYLFNFTNLGFQTYFVDQGAVDLMNSLFFDACRLGVVRASLEDAEPLIRNADMLSFDIGSIRHSDAPGNNNSTPNGFYGEEACQIMRYAGLSDKLTSLGLYEINPLYDNKGTTCHLAAQMIWYFIDGFANRKHMVPQRDKENFVKYLVPIHEHQYEIVFYKCIATDQWWMEMPCPSGIMGKYERHYLVPCSYKDYQTACNDDIPDRWWKMYQKLV